MSDALNKQCFSEPRWVNAARGYDPAVSGWPEYNGGMEMPKQVHLRVGQRYFRFASSKAPREQSQLGGGWWVEYETLNTIANFARQHATPREAARYLLALPWEFTECNVLVHGLLQKPLDAFRGTGKPARSKKSDHKAAHSADRGTTYIPPQHLVVMQLYIPGMASVRARAFPQLITEDVWKSRYFKG